MTDSIAPNEWGVAQILRDEPDSPATRATFLRSAAEYFRKRDTRGEDRAHWANVFNAENCDKAADEYEAMLAALKVAADALMTADGGDPTTETGWKSDELCQHWVAITDAIARAEGQ
jgi:hypothetical protein